MWFMVVSRQGLAMQLYLFMVHGFGLRLTRHLLLDVVGVWRSNPSRKCSQERLTRGTVTSTMSMAAHPSGRARCGAGCDETCFRSGERACESRAMDHRAFERHHFQQREETAAKRVRFSWSSALILNIYYLLSTRV